MAMNNLDHRRAGHAYQQAVKNIPEGAKEKAKRYRTVVLSAPAQLRQVGILQLAAFWLTKKDEEKAVLENVLSWLQSCERTRQLLRSDATGRPALDLNSKRLHEVMNPLLARNSTEIALLEAESEAYLGWLKRLTEGRYKMLYPSTGAK
jgi:CRISPR/Cas system CMR-associated protein Cmr5 small subunit